MTCGWADPAEVLLNFDGTNRAQKAYKPNHGPKGPDEFALGLCIVVYHEVNCRSGEVWLEYDAPDDGAELYVQLGVPVIDRLVSYRPSIAALGPSDFEQMADWMMLTKTFHEDPSRSLPAIHRF